MFIQRFLYRVLVLCTLTFLFGAAASTAQPVPPHGISPPKAHPRYVVGRVWFSDTFSIYDAEDLGVEIDHAIYKQRYVEAFFNEWTLAELYKRGVRVEVLVDNAEAWNRQRLAHNNHPAKVRRASETSSVRNFRLGSMGGFFQLEEIYENVRRMREQFPNLVSEPIRIGTSIEGRPIFSYRFCTDSAFAQRKPEVLYTALHHAREPGSAANLLYFLWFLLERFQANDPEARYLLNNRQIYTVVVINPDGYAYNQRMNPSGGGLWRKNRREHINGTFGVDLNRNYGTMEFWDSPNNGSSTAFAAETYRGSEPFSEPETQAIRELCRVRQFKTALNYHSFSNLLIYPFSYVDRETPDSTFFRAVCAEITKVNRYSGGRDLQTVGYSVRGASDDWMYAEVDGHGKIMSMTPEVGTILDNFWPDTDRIIPQCIENLPTNLHTAWSAEANLRPVQTFVSENRQTGRVRVNVEIQNIGVAQAADSARIRLTALMRGVEILTPQRTLRRLRSTEVQREVFDVQVDTMVQNGTRVPVEIVVLQEGVPRRDTVEVQVTQPERFVLFNGDGSRWQSNGNRWGVVQDRLTGRPALTDSPSGVYGRRDRNYTQYDSFISLRGLRSATLEFQARWTLEANYDAAVVQVSADSGTTWRNLRTSLTKQGLPIINTAQPVNDWCFDGNFPQWIRQEASLDEFLGRDVLLRFGVLTDNDGQFDGMYVSDIALRAYSGSPSTRVTVTAPITTFRVAPSVVLTESEIALLVPPEVTAKQAVASFVNVLGQVAHQTVVDINDGVAYLRNPFVPPGVYGVTLTAEGVALKQTILVSR
jgi:hypothetical protein